MQSDARDQNGCNWYERDEISGARARTTRYKRAFRGTNGFVCFVERSWDPDFDAVEFWNPKIRGPDCAPRRRG